MEEWLAITCITSVESEYVYKWLILYSVNICGAFCFVRVVTSWLVGLSVATK